MAPTPPRYPRHDRPPPTSYRDEHERWHPGPGCEGYREHVAACLPCWRGFRAAHDRGEHWATALGMLRCLPAPTRLPGQGEGGGVEQQHELHWHGALLHLRPQHIGPAAVMVGALAYALASLVWWLAVPLLVAMFALLVVAERRDWLAVDRTPSARALRG